MNALRPLLRRLSTGLLFALLALPAWSTAAAEEARVIVRFKAQADSVRAKALSARAGEGEALGVAQTRATALGNRRGHALTAGRSLDERTHVFTASGLSSAALAQKLAGDAEVELVAVDHLRKHTLLPNDPLFGGATVNAETTNTDGSQARTIDQWYLKAPGSNTNPAVVSSINAQAAWDISTGSSSIVVAVLDTGVRRDHPDLAGKFVSGYDMIGFGNPGSTATAIANRPAGADLTLGIDYGDWVSQADINSGKISGCTAADITNSSWHGTRVSGLIAAASNNGTGMAGVAWGVKIMPVRVLGKCGGYDSDIIAGMKWAAGVSFPGSPTAPPVKAKVLNLSLGGDGVCTDASGAIYQEAITAVNAAGAVVVVAAGNSNGQAVGLPGNCPGVISVAALRHVGTKVGFSSLGTEVTLSAPGGNCINIAAGQPCLYPMVSTVNSGATNPVLNDDAYTGSSASVGTSFSTPIVSGVVALMASVRPSLTASEVTGLLRSTARPFPKTGSSSTPAPPVCAAPSATATQDECYCTTKTCGAGMLDAAAALAAVQVLNGATVGIAQAPASGLQAGQTLTLTASISGLPTGRTVAATAWTLTDGGGIVTGFASGASTATATVLPSAAGSFSVRVQYTDDQGFAYSQTATISVAAAPVTPTPTPTTTSGGGGSGSFSPLWLALLALAALGLGRGSARRG